METRFGEPGGGRAPHRPPWGTRAWRAVGAVVGQVRADLSRPAMNRRVLHRLSSLSERELRDVGLTRQDVADAAASRDGDALGLLLARRDQGMAGRRSRAAWGHAR